MPDFRKKIKKIWNKTTPSHNRDRAFGTPSPGPSVSSTPSVLSLTTPLAHTLAITPPSEDRSQLINHAPASPIPTFAQERQADYPVPGHSPGVLAGAHHFTIGHSVMVENQQFHVHYHGAPHPSRGQLPEDSLQTIPPQSPSGRGSSNEVKYLEDKDKTKSRKKALERLKEHAIAGSEYNSGERDDPPRCHPDTRMEIRGQFRDRIEEASRGTNRVIWMHGPAGVGKSAIMQTIVEELSSRFTCGTLFFSRSNNRKDPMKAFASLAYGLAVNEPEYRDYIATCLENDPACLKKSLDAQFEILFTTPFVKNHVQFRSQPWVMFIDGLDECLNPEDSDKQYRIFNLIGDHALDHAGRTPFIWVIASRPEENLKQAWSEIGERFQERASELWELEIPADSDEATQDVERFLNREFDKIRRNHRDLGPRWPSEGDFVKVAKKSSGYFIFASTVTKYISGNPFNHLNRVVRLIDRTEGQPIAADGRNPFQLLDLLYSEIMQGIGEDLPIAKLLLGFYRHSDKLIAERLVVGRSGSRVGFVEACNILGLNQHDAYHALRKLQSVLICPPPEDALSDGIRFHHASFADFFLDATRSGTYHVDSDWVLTTVWRRYTHIIKQSRGRHSPQSYLMMKVERGEIDLSWQPDNDLTTTELQERLLSRARNGWIKILTTKSYSQHDLGCLQVDVAELIETFQSLGLAFLSGDVFSVQDFIRWLDGQAPAEVREKIAFGFLLGQLDKERLFKCLCLSTTPRYQRTRRDPQGHHVECVDLTKAITDCKKAARIMGKPPWIQAEKTLWSRSGEFRMFVNGDKVRVTVIGLKSSESCAIIGPIDDEDFFILPYSTA